MDKILKGVKKVVIRRQLKRLYGWKMYAEAGAGDKSPDRGASAQRVSESTVKTAPVDREHTTINAYRLAKPRYVFCDGPTTRLTTMVAMPASTAFASGDLRMSIIGLDPDACC